MNFHFWRHKATIFFRIFSMTKAQYFHTLYRNSQSLITHSSIFFIFTIFLGMRESNSLWVCGNIHLSLTPTCLVPAPLILPPLAYLCSFIYMLAPLQIHAPHLCSQAECILSKLYRWKNKVIQRDIGLGGQIHTINTEYLREASYLVPTASHSLQ